jgi:hypothetical protein
MTISFSAKTDFTCSCCDNRATYGFFASQGDDPDSEIFLCTGCAQRDLTRREVEDAIETHRSICFERAEQERVMDQVTLAWIEYEEVTEGIAC